MEAKKILEDLAWLVKNPEAIEGKPFKFLVTFKVPDDRKVYTQEISHVTSEYEEVTFVPNVWVWVPQRSKRIMKHSFLRQTTKDGKAGVGLIVLPEHFNSCFFGDSGNDQCILNYFAALVDGVPAFDLKLNVKLGNYYLCNLQVMKKTYAATGKVQYNFNHFLVSAREGDAKFRSHIVTNLDKLRSVDLSDKSNLVYQAGDRYFVVEKL